MRKRIFRSYAVRSGSWPLLLLALACNGGQTGDESTPHDPDADAGLHNDAGSDGEDFFDAVRRGFGSADYEPADSVAQLTEWSERVAVGTIAELPEAEPNTTPGHHVVIDVAVTEMLKGEPAETVHVMVAINIEDAPQLSAAHDQRVLVFLSPDIGDDGRAFVASPEWPEGEPLYAPVSPQGFVGEGADGSTFESDPSASIFPPTFDASIDAVRDALP